ncbi:CGNR zinc finger domain-containing protein [Cellulomonas hominis]|uniref:CGNR zinc finger domain-containing protein n=1 Tax=Cellulomonas hominis TaxID=156981 RepID=UPI001B9B78F4|nr:CGNR zinc finger domain-containing protein [Cellulomonas hominis]VTR78060.1 hypothetical protein CHMI_02836 [Cellulomonas hominis]
MSDVKTAVRADLPAGPPAGPRADPAADPLDAWVTRGAEPGVAPGVTERLRALLNTDDRFHGVDRLRGHGPSALVEVRDALRHYLVTGDGAPLGAVAAEHPLVVDVREDGLRLAPAPGSGADAALVAGVLASLHEAVGSGDWGRLKACANPDCRWIYHDASRNRSGRWCSMGECGDVMKARAYRRRGRAGTERGAAEPAGTEPTG